MEFEGLLEKSVEVVSLLLPPFIKDIGGAVMHILNIHVLSGTFDVESFFYTGAFDIYSCNIQNSAVIHFGNRLLCRAIISNRKIHPNRKAKKS